MALLDTPKSKAVAAILLAGLIAYMGYSGDGIQTVGMQGLRAKQDEVRAKEDTLLRLTAETDSVKRILARGSVEELNKRIEEYNAVLETLRQLVPDRNEVPTLLDAISARAKVRGVHVASFTPQPIEPGPAPFDTHRYRFSVVGHYDEVGEFLSDVAGLRRIFVPQSLELVKANAAAARALGDTSSSMLEARFVVKTYVKSAAALLLLPLAGCGGGEEPAPALDPAAAIEEGAPPVRSATAPRAPQAAQVDTTDIPEPGQPLVREVYTYSGGSRDPFASTLDRPGAGPEFADLTLVAVYYDTRSAAASVATVRDKVTSKRYNVRRGERLGRMRVVDVQAKDVTFAIDDYGTERRETLTLRKQEGDTP